MYCKHCGTMIDDDSNFCVNCGTPISNNNMNQSGYYDASNYNMNQSSYNNASNHNMDFEEDDIYQGTQYDSNYYYEEDKGNPGLAIAGFCISMVALLFLNLYGITGLVGAVLSGIGFRQCLNKSTVGVVFGVIGWVIGMICIFIGISYW